MHEPGQQQDVQPRRVLERDALRQQHGGQHAEQHAQEHQRVHEPGRAEQQGELHDALRLEQHERRAHAEQVGVADHRLHRPADAPDGQQRHQQDQPDGHHVEPGHRVGAQVRERVVVGGRLGGVGRRLPQGLALAVARDGVGVLGHREHGEVRDVVVAAGRQRLDARRLPEHLRERVGVPVDQPALAVVVVHREHATLGEVVAGRLDGLGGEQVALEPHRRLAGDERERVGQGEQDAVPLLVRPLEVGPPVVDATRRRGRPGTAGRGDPPCRARRACGRSRRRRCGRRRSAARRPRRCRRRRR